MMKLSEAIRLGSLLRPQVFRKFFNSEGSCALGAAFEAVGGPPNATSKVMGHYISVHLADKFSILARVIKCPVCPCPWVRALGAIMAHLNDDHQWTREAIADFVVGVEDQQAAITKVWTGVQEKVPEAVL